MTLTSSGRLRAGLFFPALLSGVVMSAPAIDSVTSTDVRDFRADLRRTERRISAAVTALSDTLDARRGSWDARSHAILSAQREEGRRIDAALRDLSYSLHQTREDLRRTDSTRTARDRSLALWAGVAVSMILALCALTWSVRVGPRQVAARDGPPRVVPANPPPARVAAPDHSLALAVAREIFRLRMRTGSADAAPTPVRRLDDELASRGYAMRDLTGLPYRDGMNARVAEFVVDPALTPGSAVVRRTLRPEVTCKGRILEPATIEVAVAVSDQSTGHHSPCLSPIPPIPARRTV